VGAQHAADEHLVLSRLWLGRLAHAPLSGRLQAAVVNRPRTRAPPIEAFRNAQSIPNLCICPEKANNLSAAPPTRIEGELNPRIFVSSCAQQRSQPMESELGLPGRLKEVQPRTHPPGLTRSWSDRGVDLRTRPTHPGAILSGREEQLYVHSRRDHGSRTGCHVGRIGTGTSMLRGERPVCREGVAFSRPRPPARQGGARGT